MVNFISLPEYIIADFFRILMKINIFRLSQDEERTIFRENFNAGSS